VHESVVGTFETGSDDVRCLEVDQKWPTRVENDAIDPPKATEKGREQYSFMLL
jgi:hypothetical protein